MPETTFHTTFPTSHILLSYAKNGSESGLRSAVSYRFGFNGKEKVDELFESSGSAYDFGARLYDSRLGRWMACDPFSKFAANWTPYHYCMNSPVCMVDIDGKWNVIYIYIAKEFTDGYTGKKIILTDEEITAIQNKIVAAFNRTDISFNAEIAFVSEPMETEYLDQTDVSVQITSIRELNEFVGTPDGSKNVAYEYISGICGATPKDVELPVGVYLGGYNVADYVAYYTMHEISHRISRLVYERYSHVNYLAFPESLSTECKSKWDAMGVEDHDCRETNLLSPGFDMKKTFGDKPIEDWDQQYFSWTQERRELLFKAYGNRNNPPTDNASKRKSENTGKKSTVIRRVPRKKNEPRSKF